MTKTLHGVIHGRTIGRADDPGLADCELELFNPTATTPPDDAECQRVLHEEWPRTNYREAVRHDSLGSRSAPQAQGHVAREP